MEPNIILALLVMIFFLAADDDDDILTGVITSSRGVALTTTSGLRTSIERESQGKEKESREEKPSLTLSRRVPRATVAFPLL
jgi:hypothetical protein